MTGGGTSYVAAGLVAAAAAAAGLSDVRDPFRRGQDATPPNAGEITLSETLHAQLSYLDPIALGRPFRIGTTWTYTRQTNANTYQLDIDEVNENIHVHIHVLSRYEIDAPDVVRVYRDEQSLICARFFGPDEQLFRGPDLLVQCFLMGPHGEFYRIVLQDDGNYPDEKANDSVYCGRFDFAQLEQPRGVRMYFVIAQDINTAQALGGGEAARLTGRRDQ